MTLGAYLILFSMYLSPVIRDAKYKNDCINNSKKGLLSVWKNNEAEKNIEEKSGLPVEEFAKIKEYRNCNHENWIDWKSWFIGKTTYLRLVALLNKYYLYVISH